MRMFFVRVHRLTTWLFYVLEMRAPASVFNAYIRSMWASRGYHLWRAERAVFEEICATRNFTTDWFTPQITSWLEVFSRAGILENQRGPLRGLEIGSWEGMSSLFLLRRFPSLHLTCVDTWLGGGEHAYLPALDHVESRFDSNTADHSERITKWHGSSASYFAALTGDEMFDIVYVDGSHFVDDVLLDALCGFRHVRVGGVIIFDDYQWHSYEGRKANPAAALNAFFRLKSREIELLSAGHQIIARRVRLPLSSVSALPGLETVS
jgi:predicted O-methyltransferase YrrM